MLLFANGSAKHELCAADLTGGLTSALNKLGKRKKVLIIPPDFSRFQSRGGELAQAAFAYYGQAVSAILPATGTHPAVNALERGAMFGDIPARLFLDHVWQTDTVTLGQVPADFVARATDNRYPLAWPVQVNKEVLKDGYDLILSLGQVVPHEVAGMSGHNKNILIGTGGEESINTSHFLAAVYGLERIMGRADTPVRRVFDYAAEHFLKDLPLVHVLTVLENKGLNDFTARGLFIGDDRECFLEAAALSREVNITRLEAPLKKAVVYLDPDKYTSAWLGNKAIYRTRMAMADGGELVILAPGLNCFAGNPMLDAIIRKYGYSGTEKILRHTRKNPDLKNCLCAAAHLIHGSTEGRFTVTLSPGKLTRREVESVNLRYMDWDRAGEIYDPGVLKNGPNVLASGEEIYFISDPGSGLWTCGRE